MKKKQTTKKQSKLSVRELQTWLDGYCSAHPDDWTPTLDQWILIKDKIFNLVEDSAPSMQHERNSNQYTPTKPQQTQRVVEVELPPYTSGLVGSPPVPSDAMMTGRSMIGATSTPPTIIRDGKHVTPNKDTPGGPSDFA